MPYSNIIIERYKNPKYQNKLKNCTIIHSEKNPLCGDELTLYIEIENKQIKHIQFDGVGCAISIASIDLLCEKIHSTTLNSVMQISKKDIIDLIESSIGERRVQCATLGLHVIQNAIRKYKQQPLITLKEFLE